MFVSWVCVHCCFWCWAVCVSAESHRFIRIAATLFGRAELHTLGPNNEHVCAHALPKPSGLLIGLCTPEHGMSKLSLLGEEGNILFCDTSIFAWPSSFSCHYRLKRAFGGVAELSVARALPRPICGQKLLYASGSLLVVFLLQRLCCLAVSA